MVTGEKVFYGSLVVVLLIVLGGKYPKIAVGFAGLILLSTIVLNIKNFQEVLNPGSYRSGSAVNQSSTGAITYRNL